MPQTLETLEAWRRQAVGDEPSYVEYVIEFVALAERLEELRRPWVQVAPADDPIRYDEAAFRVLEARLLKELANGSATVEAMQLAHNVPGRMHVVPGPQPKKDQHCGEEWQPHYTHLLRNVEEMKNEVKLLKRVQPAVHPTSMRNIFSV